MVRSAAPAGKGVSLVRYLPEVNHLPRFREFHHPEAAEPSGALVSVGFFGVSPDEAVGFADVSVLAGAGFLGGG